MTNAAQQFRLPEIGLIDRNALLSFRFDGQTFSGFRGDTLASALLANGVRLIGRSFKYHRPRGLLTAGPEEPNGLVELRRGARREPNTRMTVTELHDGLEATSQNRWPLLGFDLLSINGLLAPALTAGFYYKTFMWPASFWERLYEPAIRRAAGLGRAANAEDPDVYEKAFAFCDVLVIGGGPAGLSAALAAGRAGARVILCDDDFELGGRLLSEGREIDGTPASQWLARCVEELENLDDVRIMRRTTIFGAYDHGVFGALERVADHVALPAPHQPRQRAWRIVARRTVLAAGAMERPIVFGGNDTPGVMLAGAVRAYVNRFGVAPGREAAVFTTGDDGWNTARDLAAAGVKIVAVIDSREQVDSRLRASCERFGAPLYLGANVVGASGGKSLRRIAVREVNGAVRTLDCDLLAVSNGWNPTIHLASHQGHRPVWNLATSAFVAGTLPDGMSVVGSAAGRFSLGEALTDGSRLGAEAARDCGFATKQDEPTPTTDPESVAVMPVWRVARARGKAFVDYQNDVTDKDIELAAREGFTSVEHLKRYTTLGMATDQGKTSNLAGLAIMAELTGKSIAETGVTMFRPPYAPVAIGALAGHHRGQDFRPVRLAPTHQWSKEAGAVFVNPPSGGARNIIPDPARTIG